MLKLLAYSAFAMTVSLSVARPRIGPRWRIDPYLPFTFAVFAAVGVAPLVVSIPLNKFVASHAELNFNEYAARMLPIAAVGWVVAYAVLRTVARGLPPAARRRCVGAVRQGRLSGYDSDAFRVAADPPTLVSPARA